MTKYPSIVDLEEVKKQWEAKSYELVCVKDIVMRGKQWIWRGHLLRGAQELLTGVPGLGKSQVQINYIACTTASLTWPDGAKPVPPKNVIMLTAEDTLDDEVKPRLLAAGANIERVHVLKKIRKDGEGRQFLLSEDLDTLEKAVNATGEVGLITIDPITSYMGGKMDSHKATEVRSQLGPLKDFAERMRVSVSTITHPPKSAGQRAIDHFIGSQAFVAACRIGHVCVEEVIEDDDGKKQPTGRVLFTNAKNNSHAKMPTLAYRVVPIVVGRDEDIHEDIVGLRIAWDGVVDITADQAVGAALGGDKKKQRGEQGKVQDFLSDILDRESRGFKGQGNLFVDGVRSAPGVLASFVIAAAKQQGITERQLEIARKALGIGTKKTAKGNVWFELGNL